MSDTDIKVIELETLPKFDHYQNLKPMDEQTAVDWAERMGAKTLYKFRQHDTWLWIVEAKNETSETDE
jgi:hypothetical protein